MRRAGANGVRWMIAGGALLMAAIAGYVLLNVGGGRGLGEGGQRRLDRPGTTGPALDQIDAKSRSELRDVLRDADEGD